MISLTEFLEETASSLTISQFSYEMLEITAGDRWQVSGGDDYRYRSSGKIQGTMNFAIAPGRHRVYSYSGFH
ncbi:MAG: hypothetical protein K6T90_21060 [Leptolyngbyaceae cyanobacterium HOT.MB2.61]|nr:hypothetical protein [Leptolyngbyaceae cyanobacterium HOT.MB2.61]